MFTEPSWLVQRCLSQLDSMVIDIDGNRLDAKFLRETAAIDDQFTIIKGGRPAAFRLATLRISDGTITATWKSSAGSRYQLEKTSRLVNPARIPAGPVLTAT